MEYLEVSQVSEGGSQVKALAETSSNGNLVNKRITMILIVSQPPPPVSVLCFLCLGSRYLILMVQIIYGSFVYRYIAFGP